MSSNAIEKRRAAVERLCSWALYIHPVDGTVLAHGVTREGLLEAANELYALGRTDRWRGAVTAWRQNLATCPRERLVFEVLEGSTHAGYAAL